MAVTTSRVRPGRMPNPFTNVDRGRRERIIVGGLIVLALLYPFAEVQRLIAATPLGALPLPNINNLIVMTYYATLALGLNIVVGFAGLLDLGYVAFFVFGAYTTAFLASPHFGVHIPWWIVVVIAVAVSAIWGLLLGAPTLKLRGDYLAIVTLGFGEIVPALVRILDNVNVTIGNLVLIGPDLNLTGGGLGINPIDAPIIPLAGPWGSELRFSNNSPQLAFYLSLAILLLCFFICVRLRDSRLGRAWMAVREDETAAESMGINTVNTKLLAFALGASFSGFVGAFVGAYQTAIFPETFKFSISISILISVILGGMGSLRGVVVGAFVIQYVNNRLLSYLGTYVDDPLQTLGDSTSIPILSDILSKFTLVSYNFLIFGIILVLMMIYRPEGLLPTEARKAELHGEGIAADQTFGTESTVAEAATEYEEQVTEDPTAGIAGDEPAGPAIDDGPPAGPPEDETKDPR
jgi:branched-chain amino acid transport system permease protein